MKNDEIKNQELIIDDDSDFYFDENIESTDYEKFQKEARDYLNSKEAKESYKYFMEHLDEFISNINKINEDDIKNGFSIHIVM